MSQDNEKPIQHTSGTELTHSMAHYLLTIHKLREDQGYARVTDIAKELKLTKGSVSTALSNLKKRELVVEDSNKFLLLSDEGHTCVHAILSARTLMFYFLKDILGVDADAAHKDSCLVEHLLSDSTREALFQFMKKVISTNDSSLNLKTDLDLNVFEHYEDFLFAQKGDRYL